jgi:hypothetical protein
MCMQYYHVAFVALQYFITYTLYSPHSLSLKFVIYRTKHPTKYTIARKHDIFTLFQFKSHRKKPVTNLYKHLKGLSHETNF